MVNQINIVRFGIEAEIEWRAFRDPKTDMWIGVCDALAVTAEADTWEELERTIHEVQGELFLSLHEDGELYQFLLDRGWRPITALPRHPVPVKLDLPTKVVPVHAHA